VVILKSSGDAVAANFDRARSWLVEDFPKVCRSGAAKEVLGAAKEVCEWWTVWLRSDLVEARLIESERVSIIDSGRIAKTRAVGVGE